MKNVDTHRGTRRETIRTTDWASRLRLGGHGAEESHGDPVDDGCCADLDQDFTQTPRTTESNYVFGMAVADATGNPTIGSEILGVVRSLMPRAQSAGIRIRVEIDPSASSLTAGPLGTILFGMLRRAVDGYAIASAQGATFEDEPEINLCARRDGGLVRLHVLDGARMRDVPSAAAALGLAAATTESLGGTLEICTVPFGQDTLLTATVPVSRLACNNEHAA